MLCGKTENNSINKIHKRTFQLIYEMQDAVFEDLLERDKSKYIHENNIYTLKIEIYKSIHHGSPQIMRNFFDRRVNQYNFQNNYILELPADMVPKQYVLRKVFFGIRFQANIKT